MAQKHERLNIYKDSRIDTKKKFTMVLISLIFVIAVIKAISMVNDQHLKISTYQPVEAEVISSEVGINYRSSKRGTTITYYPIVYYKYQVSNTPYTGNKVYPFTLCKSRSWAKDIAEQYKSEDIITVYYNPNSPVDAFIIPKYNFFPYFMVLLFILLTMLSPLCAQAAFELKSNPPPPRATANGMFIIKPYASIQRRKMVSFIYLVIITVTYIPCFLHYLRYSNLPHSTFFFVCLAFSAVLIGLILVLSVFYLLVSWNFKDAVFFSSIGEFKRGEKVKIKIHQEIKRKVTVKKAKLGLVIYHRGRKGGGEPALFGDRRPIFNDFHTDIRNFQVPAGETICVEAELELPDNMQESTPAGVKVSPRCEWVFHYELDVEGSFDYRAKYPVMVK